ncbi:MAG TPA: type II secretion system protein N [Gammaproteobacteria bacterium]|jgi:general secretion pathway protein N|nr:type II secretion system protein N [Gammaproteobacteria bacterium]
MTRRVLRWLVPGALAYLIFLGATFPASYALHWLQPSLPGVQLGDISGSIWSGQARQLVFDSVPLGAVSWQFDWRAPWSGSLGYRLSLDGEGTRLGGRVRIGRGGRLVIRDLVGRLPLQRLDHWLPLPPDSVAGLLQLDLTSLIVTNGLPQTAEGSVTLDSASLNWPQAAVLGSYQMQLKTGQGITGEIRDTNGPLALQAQVTLQTDGQYRVNGVLSARDSGSAAAHLLTYLGPPGPDGKYPFDFAGRL